MVPIMPRNAKLRSHSAFFPKKLMSSNNAATAISHNKFSGCSTVVLAFPTILYPNLFLFPCKNVFRFPPCQVYFSFFVPILLAERTVNVMKIFFSQADASPEIIEEDFSPIDLKESIRKPARRWKSPMRVSIMLWKVISLTVIFMKSMRYKKGISISQSWPLCSRRIRKKIYTNIPRFVPWSAMFSVNWFLP